MATTSPEITKRRVTMRNVSLAADGATITEEAVDYVTPDFLDAYVDDARTRWQHVAVSDEPDAGPGGYDGQTVVPADIDHPDAGTTRAATSKES